MPVARQLSHCLQLLDSMHRLVRAEKWQKLQAVGDEYADTFVQLKAEVAAGIADAADLPAMIRLEQQQRRLQRLISAGMKETGEKLAVIDDTRKRLRISGNTLGLSAQHSQNFAE